MTCTILVHACLPFSCERQGRMHVCASHSGLRSTSCIVVFRRSRPCLCLTERDGEQVHLTSTCCRGPEGVRKHNEGQTKQSNPRNTSHSMQKPTPQQDVAETKSAPQEAPQAHASWGNGNEEGSQSQRQGKNRRRANREAAQ